MDASIYSMSDWLYVCIQVMMIAAHPWDTHGAQAAGLRATYVDRSNVPFPHYFIQPDYIIGSLKDLGDMPIW